MSLTSISDKKSRSACIYSSKSKACASQIFARYYDSQGGCSMMHLSVIIWFRKLFIFEANQSMNIHYQLALSPWNLAKRNQCHGSCSFWHSFSRVCPSRFLSFNYMEISYKFTISCLLPAGWYIELTSRLLIFWTLVQWQEIFKTLRKSELVFFWYRYY